MCVVVQEKETARLFEEVGGLESCLENGLENCQSLGGDQKTLASLQSSNTKLKYRIKHLNEVLCSCHRRHDLRNVRLMQQFDL